MPELGSRESKAMSVVASILTLCEKISDLEQTISEMQNPITNPITNNKFEKVIPTPKTFMEVWNTLPQQIKELSDRVTKVNEEIRQIIF